MTQKREKKNELRRFCMVLLGIWLGILACVLTVGAKAETPGDMYDGACTHVWGEWIPEIPATYTQEGVAGHAHCDLCGANKAEDGTILDTLTIPKLTSTVTFRALGKVVAVEPYVYGESGVTLPEVPQALAYDGAWPAFELSGGHTVVTARYTPQVWEVTFCADGSALAVRNYTIADASYDIPAVPTRDGLVGSWHLVSAEDRKAVVDAVYTEDFAAAHSGHSFVTVNGVCACLDCRVLCQGLLPAGDGETVYYVNGQPYAAGLMLNTDQTGYLFVDATGRMVHDCEIPLTEDDTHGWLKPGTYRFGSDGVMIGITVTAAAGLEGMTVDGLALRQTVDVRWVVYQDIPAFSNILEANSKTFPYSGGFGYFQPFIYFGSSNFVSGHVYFTALHYTLSGDSTAKIMMSGDRTYFSEDGTLTVSGSGWLYIKQTMSHKYYPIFSRDSAGSGVIDSLYVIDMTALQEAGVIDSLSVSEMAALFGGLSLAPGQDFEGRCTNGEVTLFVNGVETYHSSQDSVITVQAGDVLRAEGGAAVFQVELMRPVPADGVDWEVMKWVAFGNSLTDPSINASVKYPALLAQELGLTVTVLARGGTGYFWGYDAGISYSQRMYGVPHDADIITIFGSVNDWKYYQKNLSVGDPDDTLADNTLCGYINEAIDVSMARAPYAKICMVSPLYYYGVSQKYLINVLGALQSVAEYRGLPYYDLFNDQYGGLNFQQIQDPVFAQKYTTDYSDTASSYGHPNNAYHSEWLAPRFRYILVDMLTA